VSEGRVLALDVGARRIGIAVSDGMVASTAGVIHRKGMARDLDTLRGLIDRHDAARIVVGLPLSLSGEIGPQARVTLEFVDALKEALTVPVETFDERYTSAEAEATLRAQGVKARKIRARVDEFAAATILQGWLDARQVSPAAPLRDSSLRSE